jgi:hypothetical protein
MYVVQAHDSLLACKVLSAALGRWSTHKHSHFFFTKHIFHRNGPLAIGESQSGWCIVRIAWESNFYAILQVGYFGLPGVARVAAAQELKTLISKAYSISALPDNSTLYSPKVYPLGNSIGLGISSILIRPPPSIATHALSEPSIFDVGPYPDGPIRLPSLHMLEATMQRAKWSLQFLPGDGQLTDNVFHALVAQRLAEGFIISVQTDRVCCFYREILFDRASRPTGSFLDVYRSLSERVVDGVTCLLQYTLTSIDNQTIYNQLCLDWQPGYFALQHSRQPMYVHSSLVFELLSSCLSSRDRIIARSMHTSMALAKIRGQLQLPATLAEEQSHHLDLFATRKDAPLDLFYSPYSPFTCITGSGGTTQIPTVEDMGSILAPVVGSSAVIKHEGYITEAILQNFFSKVRPAAAPIASTSSRVCFDIFSLLSFSRGNGAQLPGIKYDFPGAEHAFSNRWMPDTTNVGLHHTIVTTLMVNADEIKRQIIENDNVQLEYVLPRMLITLYFFFGFLFQTMLGLIFLLLLLFYRRQKQVSAAELHSKLIISARRLFSLEILPNLVFAHWVSFGDSSRLYILVLPPAPVTEHEPHFSSLLPAYIRFFHAVAPHTSAGVNQTLVFEIDASRLPRVQVGSILNKSAFDTVMHLWYDITKLPPSEESTVQWQLYDNGRYALITAPAFNMSSAVFDHGKRIEHLSTNPAVLQNFLSTLTPGPVKKLSFGRVLSGDVESTGQYAISLAEADGLLHQVLSAPTLVSKDNTLLRTSGAFSVSADPVTALPTAKLMDDLYRMHSINVAYSVYSNILMHIPTHLTDVEFCLSQCRKYVFEINVAQLFCFQSFYRHFDESWLNEHLVSVLLGNCVPVKASNLFCFSLALAEQTHALKSGRSVISISLATVSSSAPLQLRGKHAGTILFTKPRNFDQGHDDDVGSSLYPDDSDDDDEVLTELFDFILVSISLIFVPCRSGYSAKRVILSYLFSNWKKFR